MACSRGDVVDRFRVLADVTQTRRTTAAALAEVARGRRGLPHRAELLALLADRDAGACSVLDREHLLLEQRHGLGSNPAAVSAERQVLGRVRGGRVFRDVEHGGARLVVELDGRAFHDTAAARDRDAVRDLESAVDGDRLTVRLTWSMVTRDGCRTMAAIGRLLRRRGSTWVPTRCPACPPGVADA